MASATATRTHVVTAEDRTTTIPAETRLVAVAAEDRTTQVPAESRTLTVEL